jgi:hypothetical protein
LQRPVANMNFLGHARESRESSARGQRYGVR